MPQKIKFSVLANLEDWDTFNTICNLADQLGYHSIMLGDHISWPVFDPWTALSAIASITERITLSQLVTNNTYRHPTILAKIAASVDKISNGRVEIGIGAGSYRKDEYLTYGLPYYPHSERVGRLRESLHIIKELWQKTECTFDGDYYKVKQAQLQPTPVQQPFPSFHIGGTSQEMMKITANQADIWNIGFDQSPKDILSTLEQFTTICDELDKKASEIEKSMGIALGIGESSKEQQRSLEKLADSYNTTPQEINQILEHSAIGTPNMVIERINTLIETGITSYILWGNTSDPHQLELFAEKVMSNYHSNDT